MIMVDSDYDDQTMLVMRLLTWQKYVQFSGICTLIISRKAERYLHVIFAQEEEYVALITGQHWSSGPWGNTSQHLPALVRWKISICWSSLTGWIVVFRVLDAGFWKAPEPDYNESHTAPSLYRGTSEWADPGRTQRNAAVQTRPAGGLWPFTDSHAGSSRAVGAYLHMCVCVCLKYRSLSQWFCCLSMHVKMYASVFLHHIITNV